MKYKCNFCDPTVTKKMKEEGIKPTKSIDTEKDEFVKDDKGKYYHLNCFKNHLAKRKKLDESEIEKLLFERLEITKLENQENEEKDNFLQWIMDYYDGSLPAYFLKKLQSVRDGSHQGLNEPIDYSTLLDIYNHMEKYLRKVAAQKNIRNVTQQMNYDLAVVVGNYGDYKRYKAKQKLEQDKTEVAKKAVNEQSKIKTALDKKKNNDGDSFSLHDVLDDILL
ncbi:hypothetical protein P4V41_07775 [Fictibacillus nanhaiensis]|uniref:hypothetical protein n=1 Tax=Fictibacillus nanhaiensis TaxID=742169 RepID=UPI002E220534|nr:hypothetical protein [Fictibacillus nanhaiensis]